MTRKRRYAMALATTVLTLAGSGALAAKLPGA
jgi:hypothetical protein